MPSHRTVLGYGTSCQSTRPSRSDRSDSELWYSDAMRTTIDKAGRLVVPKPLRDALGLSAGVSLEMRESDGELILRPIGPRARVVHRHGRAVLTVDDADATLTSDEVRDLLERTRR